MKLFRRLTYLLLPGLLLACGEQRNAAEKPAAAALPPAPAPAPRRPAPPDTVDLSQTNHGYQEGRDTTFLVDGQRYRLLLRADTDSTKPLLAVSEGLVGDAYAADTSTFAQTQQVRGYEGGQTITLLDPAGRQVFRRRLRKQDFFGVASPDIVTVSEPRRPRFIGYHAPSQLLAFTVGIGIPASDVGQDYLVLLGLDGRVRRLAATYAAGVAPDCTPRLLPDGTVLTCQELLRPDGRRISLLKPKAELVAAFPLSDTILLTTYQFGEYRPRQPEPPANSRQEGQPVDVPVSAGFNYPEWVPDKRMRNAPNGFVINTQGQVRQRFKAPEAFEALGYQLPRAYVWQTHCYYLSDGEKGLLVLDKHQPTGGTRIGFRQMQRFRKPRKPAEVRFEVSSSEGNFAFYVDPARPTQLRYQRIESRD
jgi:hypothetical protein